MLFFDRVAALEREQATFAIATVVARRSPVSSHLGDRALVFCDGHMEGFVGGSCSRDIVRRHALDAIRRRRPILLQIRSDDRCAAAPPAHDDGGTTAERVVIPMSCSSEGAVDVYIEPRLPLRRLVVVGFTPVADALADLAGKLDFAVVRVVDESELRDMDAPAAPSAGGGGERDTRLIGVKALRGFLSGLDDRTRGDVVAVVASQGHYDELSLEMLLETPLAFTGLVASRRRAATVLGVLAQLGVPADRLATIRHPVGLDIGARSPGEVAVSILAHIIAHGQAAEPPPAGPSAQPDRRTAVDPICGMDVDPDSTPHRLEHAGRTRYFCCAGCAAAFAADPDRALLSLPQP